MYSITFGPHAKEIEFGTVSSVNLGVHETSQETAYHVRSGLAAEVGVLREYVFLDDLGWPILKQEICKETSVGLKIAIICMILVAPFNL